jgi:transposase-like protein
MKAKRKRHSAAFKAKVGFEALVGLKTVSQLAREYVVHPTQVTQWRATIRDHMPELFEPGQGNLEEVAQFAVAVGQGSLGAGEHPHGDVAQGTQALD